QVADIARTQGELNALEEARRVHPEMTSEQLKETQAYRDAQAEYGTGSGMQRAIQAAIAAAQGLSGGDISAALAGAAAPYVAEIIGHRSGLDETMEKAAAHAVANAVLAAIQGKDAFAGAAGAAAGELAGGIALKMYGKDVTALSESEKQTISALATLAAGIAGGVAGDGTASAIAGAQAGKTVVENNLMAGSEDAQVMWLQQHGTDMATCSDNPMGSACQKAKNERDAVGLALASGGVALLPGGAQGIWGLGAGANAGVNYWVDGSIDPANAAIAGWVNVLSMGNGLTGTVGWNAIGGALGNWIDNKDPLSGALINGAGSGIGYGIGKGLSWGVNAGANWSKGGWDPKFNADLRQFTEVKGELGLSKEMKPSNIPSSFGDLGGSVFSEITGKGIENISSRDSNRKNK
ncbi:VENN motif pre-toxin domain-containing protein, partial [Enterobacter cancerogenus]|uniref:VENN motif pre-toxin domain-containing protein n=1 Tax=Enterobacter cancerogenus TaxID=69218 RepID=UPI0030765ADE